MKKKETKRKQNIFFTAEVFGMALALFSVLGLLCLITGNLIFGDEIGVPVLRFFLGVSGYLSFPILALLTFFGIKLLLGFKIQNVAVKKTIWASCTYAFIIGLILQSALTDLSVKTIGEYINACYQSGMSYASSTAGGVFLGSISYFMASVLSPAGAYVLYALALALFTLYLSRNKIGEMISERNKEATDDQREAKEKPGKQKKFFVPLNLLKNNKASTNEASPELAVTHSNSFEEPAQPKKNVIFGGGKFELRDSKDKNKSSNNLRILFGEQDGIKAFAPKNSKPEGLFGSPIESERSYRESYDRDLDKKTDFIRTPYTTTERPAVTSPMGDSPRSERRDYYSTSENESLNIDISQPESDIYVVRGTPKERESISSFDKMARGENSTNDNSYNSDRFTKTDNDSVRDRFSSSNEEYNRDRFSSSNEEYNRDRFSSSNEDFSTRINERIPERDASLNSFERDSAPNSFNEDRSFNSSNIQDERNSAFDRISEERAFNRDESTFNERVAEREFERSDLNAVSEERADANKEANVYDDFAPEKEESTYDEGFGGSFFIDAGKKRQKPAIFQDQSYRTYEQSPTKPASTYEAPVKPIVSAERRVEQPSVVNQAVTGKQISINDIPEENQLINPIDNIPKNYKYVFPPISLLEDYLPDEKQIAKNKEEQSKRSDIILNTLAQTNIEAKIEDIRFGPTITRFELSIPITVQVKRVTERYEDLNLWLASREKIRLITPIQGTTRIGVEVPNSSPGMVGLKSIIETKEFKNAKKGGMVFALGKDVIGTPITLDIATMPHLLVAGATGTGKSVFLNTLLLSLIYKYSPEELRLILVDPKKVEFSKYRGMPNLMFNEIFTDNANVCSMLEWTVQEMEERYKMLEESGQKNINEYNEFVGPRGKKMFKILIIIDEFADLMMSSNERKLMENKISRLAAKSRAAGIHLIMATQRPSTDIMEGSIKTNFISRIAFKSSSGTDSQIIIGEVGAEKLLGKGDMLFKMGNMPVTERAQCCYVDTPEIDAVCKFVKENNESYYDEFALEKIIKGAQEEDQSVVQVSSSSQASTGGGHIGAKVDEDLVKEIMRFAITVNNISISGMQRKFSLGFPRAGKMLEILIERGYVSPIAEGKQRKILMTREQFAEIYGEPV